MATKRAVDLAIAAGISFLLAPVAGLTAIAIFIRLGRPVVFRQLRPGYQGQPFYVYKFRTMMKTTEVDGRKLSDGERMGRLGKLLRRTSLDELPQLWNVLKGDMSIVGPRPLLIEYLDLYTPEQMRRHDARPGITGLAQVSGRNNLPWEERFELDVWYVDNWSLWLDFKIMLLSVQKVVLGQGVSSKGVSTMTSFTGTGDKKT